MQDEIKHPGYAVYILLSLKDLQFYIGYTSNFQRRMGEHAEGKTKSTACRRPFICVFCEYYLAKADAMRREDYFKTSAGKRVLRLMLQDSLRPYKKQINNHLDASMPVENI